MTPQERAEFIADLTLAMKSSQPTISSEEHRWVQLAMQRQAESIELRRAIIEKSLVGLVWVFIGFIGYVFLDYIKAHGFK